MTNINKTIEETKKELWNKFKSVLGKSSIDNKNNSMYDLEAFIIKALKTKEAKHQKVTDFLIESHALDMKELKEKHQKKLEELERECVGEKKGYNKFLNEIEQAYLNGMNQKRQEIKETFRTINKT